MGPIATFALAFKNGPRQLRLLIVLTGMLLIAALLKPIASDSMPQWFALLVGAGSRYFFIPTLAFYACVIYLALNKAEVHTYIGFVYKILLVLVLLVAIPTEFNYQPRDDYDFEVYAAKFKSSNRSEKYCLPIPPEWDMCLDKK